MPTSTANSIYPYSVLIVDDEKLNRDLMMHRLINAGFLVTTAENGSHAIELMEIERYDLLLLDLNMPVKNGFEVLEWLKNNAVKNMHVIMLTAAGERDSVNTCLTLGADDYVLKSAGRIELMQRIDRACRGSRLSNQNENLPAENDWNNASILLVDDNEMNLRLVVSRLENQQVQTKLASDGHAALELLESCDFDLILLDYHMPGINGHEVLQHIRQRKPAENIGIIMLTGEDDPDIIADLYDAGIDDYIAKPFHANELLQRSLNVLKDKRLIQQKQRLNAFQDLGESIRGSSGTFAVTLAMCGGTPSEDSSERMVRRKSWTAK